MRMESEMESEMGWKWDKMGWKWNGNGKEMEWDGDGMEMEWPRMEWNGME